MRKRRNLSGGKKKTAGAKIDMRMDQMLKSLGDATEIVQSFITPLICNPLLKRS